MTPTSVAIVIIGRVMATCVVLHILITMRKNTCMCILHSVVILILAINSLKMKHNVDFLVLQLLGSLSAKFISK